MLREELRFRSENEECAAWWYVPSSRGPHPAVVMAHGMGLTREHGLDAFARRFCAAGLCVLSFDYRHYGASGGMPRELLSVARQQSDFRAAFDFTRLRPEVDPRRVALWGYSFSGGHVMSLTHEALGARAAIALAPFSSGYRTARAIDRSAAIALNRRAVQDLWAALRNRDPVYVPLVGPSDSGALMAGEAHEQGYRSLIPAGAEEAGAWRNRVAARIALRIPFYEPGRALQRSCVPTLVAVCERDTLAPAEYAIRAAARGRTTTLLRYACDHFACFHDKHFERAVTDQISFLRTHLGPFVSPEIADPGDERARFGV